jgi:hypothetical protein
MGSGSGDSGGNWATSFRGRISALFFTREESSFLARHPGVNPGKSTSIIKTTPSLRPILIDHPRAFLGIAISNLWASGRDHVQNEMKERSQFIPII